LRRDDVEKGIGVLNPTCNVDLGEDVAHVWTESEEEMFYHATYVKAGGCQ
ncbi:hypothetical protein NDU88_002897, partial [Pleurodeles waltl]